MIKKEIVKAKAIKNNKKKIEKELTRLWREYALIRAGYKCEYQGCHKTEYLNVHHVYSRSRRCVKWDVENAMVLCSGHHSLLYESAHKDPDFKDKILGRIPGYKPIRTETWYTALQLRANTPQKLDLNMELLYLQNELKKYGEKG